MGLSNTRMIALLLLSVQAVSGQVIFWDDIQYEPDCGLEEGVGTWSVEGRLYWVAENRIYFDSKVIMLSGYTGHTICEIDLNTCGAAPPDPIPSNYCYCSRGGGANANFFLVVHRLAELDESEKPLVSAFPLLSGCDPTQLTQTVGLMPPVYNDREMVYGMYSVENSPMETLLANQTVAVCSGHYIDLKFCIYNLIPEFHVTVSDDTTGSITTATTECIMTTKVFNFTVHSVYELSVSYDENTWCPRAGTYNLNFEETIESCPAELCDTVVHESCDDFVGALPRHVATLPNGEQILCDTKTDGGGWHIFQRRLDSEVDFYRNWTEYRHFFGNVLNNYWSGLDTIHYLCHPGACELRIDFKFGATEYYAHYDTFIVDGPEKNYKLHISGFTGTGGLTDDMLYHNEAEFSTYDQDHDGHTGNCAQRSAGAWWYYNCHAVNFNGIWGRQDHKQGMNWNSVTGMDQSVTFTEMKIRYPTSNLS